MSDVHRLTQDSALAPSPTTVGVGALSVAGWALALLLISYVVAASPPAMKHDADSLIPIFVSLESWSLFYWGQDRFGMLVPLLAWPVRDGFANLMVQNVLGLAILLTGMTAAFARLGVRRPQVLALALLALIVTLGHTVVFTLLTTNQSYTAALGCFGLALYYCREQPWLQRLLSARWLLGGWVGTWPSQGGPAGDQRAGGGPAGGGSGGAGGWPQRLTGGVSIAQLLPGPLPILLMLLGAWANGGVAILVFFVAAALALPPVTRQTAVQAALAAFASIVGHRALQILAPERTTWLLLPSPGDVPGLFLKFWTEVYALTPPGFWLVALLLWAGAAWSVRGLGTRRPREREPNVWLNEGLALLGVIVAAVAYGTLMAIMFKGRGRYFVPVLPLVLGAPLAAAATAGAAWTRAAASPIAALVAAALVLAVSGVRLPNELRQELMVHLGRGHARQLHAQQIAAVTGDYWHVWPVVFATNLLYEEEGKGRPVLPVAFRSEPIRDRRPARLTPGAPVVIIPPSDDLTYWHSQHDLPPLHEPVSARGGYALARVAATRSR